jgi:hypothetical protein
MAAEKEPEVDTVKLQFHYIKGPAYREGACHGAVGGSTPQGKIWMALFSERYPLPRMVEFNVPAPPHGTTTLAFNESSATPDHIDTRNGIVRHIEFAAYLDVDTAVRLRDWLSLQISQNQRRTAS